jgi:secondary thiamine-phosphate synthase enzyme
MRQALHRLTVETRGKGLTDISGLIFDWIAPQRIETGLLTVWCRHTSASLTVQENADPTVRADILRFFEALVPEETARYEHEDEGPDDMPAHLRTMLTETQISIQLQTGSRCSGSGRVSICSSIDANPTGARSCCT